MIEGRGWRWAGLAAIGAFAALFASFNSGERVALNLGFAVMYRVPLVLLIFVAFLAGMITMFLLGLRHDLRVRRALREAGFGAPTATEEEEAPRWEDDDPVTTELPPHHALDAAPPPPAPTPPALQDPERAHPGRHSDLEPPPR